MHPHPHPPLDSTLAYREEHVVGQEVTGQALDLFGEGGTEHQRLALASRHHVLLLHDPVACVQ